MLAICLVCLFVICLFVCFVYLFIRFVCFGNPLTSNCREVFLSTLVSMLLVYSTEGEREKSARGGGTVWYVVDILFTLAQRTVSFAIPLYTINFALSVLHLLNRMFDSFQFCNLVSASV